MTSAYAYRVVVVGGLALTLVTATSSVVLASDGAGSHGRLGNGKSLEARTPLLNQSRLSKDGRASNAVVIAIAAYEAARDKAIIAFQTLSLSAREAYQGAISPAALSRKSSLEAATSALHIALESAITDNGKATADDAFKSAVRAANQALNASNVTARINFRALIKSAEQTLKASLEAANAALRQSVSEARNSHPMRTSPRVVSPWRSAHQLPKAH